MSPKLLSCFFGLLAVSATHGWWFWDKEDKKTCFKDPQSADIVQTEFYLFTKRNPDTPQDITDQANIPTSNYDENLDTKILIHGYKSNTNAVWITQLVSAILKREDVNIVVANWEATANDSPFIQVAANTRTVGENVASFIKKLGADLNRVHVIGHGLGAQVAGFAGQSGVTPARITGLDPTGLCFQNAGPNGGLSLDDAKYVDVIHTAGRTVNVDVGNVGKFALARLPLTGLLLMAADQVVKQVAGKEIKIGFGTLVPMGHADFYPNGGVDQPGCATGVLPRIIKSLTEGIRKTLACNHRRATELFIASVDPANQFLACSCQEPSMYSEAACNSCENSAPMGYYSSSAAGILTVKTEYGA